MAMNSLQNEDRLQENLDAYLNRACEAEARGDFDEAERMFRFALHCEAHSRSDVGNASEYVQRVGPLYEQKQVAKSVGNSETNPSEINSSVSHG